METTRAPKFTRQDYMRLPEGFPAELIDGDFVKSLTPTVWHQRIVVKIAARLEPLVESERVLVAPVDVFVDDWNVLQPDVAVLAPEDAVKPGTKSDAVPVLVLEVLSPSTAARDRAVKTDLYLRAGVREVWLVDPDARLVEVHTRKGATQFREGEEAASAVAPEFRLDWRDLTPRA